MYGKRKKSYGGRGKRPVSRRRSKRRGRGKRVGSYRVSRGGIRL